MCKRTFLILVIFLTGLVAIGYAQQDKPTVQKGRLLPAPQIVRSTKAAQLIKGPTSTVFEEDFETGGTSWSTSGVWAIGSPTAKKCAATNLTGSYPNNADDWLFSPSISLPVLTTGSSILELVFQEQFETESGYDYGKVEISTDGGSSWSELDSRAGSSDWRKTTINLSSYAGQTIKLGFHFTSDGSNSYNGWYIDDVQISILAPSTVFEENFEIGGTSWSAGGAWAIGKPTSSPYSGYNSANCVAINLAGDYPNNADDWLISPTISLPTLTYSSSRLELNFWEWFETESGYDYGRVEISTDGGSSWTQLDSRAGSSDWRPTTINLSSYAGQAVKLGLHFTSDGSNTYSGWYVDDIQIIFLTTTSTVFEENFDARGTSWSTSGSWEIGSLTLSGPGSGHNSENCAATDLFGNYPNNADDWLISPTIFLPLLTHPSSQLKLNFWEWFETESGYDYGRIEISTDGGSNWTQLDSRAGSSDWRLTTIDLSSYAGQTVKLGFNFTSDGSGTYSGWYIDDVQIILEEPQPLMAILVSLNHQNFPFIYMNVAVDTFDVGFPDLVQSNFKVYENGALQTDYFEVTPPETGGGVRLADIVFVLDVTGSMEDEIEAVRQNMLSFVNALASSGIDYGIGFVVFGDVTYTYNNGNMYYDRSQILSIINNIRLGEHGIGSGEDNPENQLGAMAEASVMNYRPGAQKVHILLTDAPAHEADWVTPWTVEALIDLLKSANITVFTVFDVTDPEQRAQYIPIAEATNPRGTYYHIYDNFNSIIDEIGSIIANTYLIRYKSSNPVLDGTLRNVQVSISYAGNKATCEGSYISSIILIQRTKATLDLHNRAWAEGTEFTIEAEIVDNVAPYVQSATLYYRATGATSYSSPPLSLFSGDTYQGMIPGSAVHTPGLDYYITATDGQTTSSDPSVDPTNNPYQIAILPNVAPVITHMPVTTLTLGTPAIITAQIVDNTNFVASAKLYYRKAAQLIYQDVDMNNIGGNIYEGVIPSTFVTNEGVEYYLLAKDDFGVSGYYGTPDVPILIMSPLYYVTGKEAIINYFLGENFYVDAEKDAQNFTDQVEQKISAGTATNKDIEALQRLSLVEGSAMLAYPGAIQIAELSAKCTQQLAAVIFVKVVFNKLADLLKPLKNVSGLKHLYKGIQRLVDKFDNFINQIRLRAVGQIGPRLIPILRSLGLSTSSAQSASMKIANEVFKEGESALYKQAINSVMNILSFDPSKNLLQNLYTEIYRSGVTIDFSSIGLGSGIFWIGGTERAIMVSVQDAEDQNFHEGTVNIVTQTIRNFKDPEIIQENINTINAINRRIDWSELSSKLSLVAIVIATLSGVIVGIASCPAGGIGCIVSAISGLGGVWATVSILLTFFNIGQIGLYSWGMGEGLYRLHYSLPNQLNEVQQIAFDKTDGPLLKNPSNEEVSTMSFASIPDHLADSLVVVGDMVIQEISEIRSLIQQGKWEEAGAKFESLSPNLEQLSSKQNIVNSVLDVSYLYNSSASVARLDSIYHYTGAYTAANDIGLGFSQFAIGFALLVKPKWSELDTLFVILDESINRLQAVGFAYKQTFNQFNSWGFQAPPIVSIIDYDIEESKAGYSVLCRIKNISDRAVHDAATSLKGPFDVDVRVIPETDTLFSILNPSEEKTMRWRVNYYGLDKVLILDLDVHPLVIPGDFQGDRKMISQLIAETSPPTRGTLDNKNIYAFPNPFNPNLEDVTLRFKLAKAGNVTIKIYDASNTLVTTVVSDLLMEANTELAVKWDGRNDLGDIVANGVYFYVIESSSGEKAVGKVAVLR